MHKFRVGLIAALATAGLAVAGAAPAVASTGPDIYPPVEGPTISYNGAVPVCIPPATVTGVQNCAVQTALWAAQQANPVTLINTINAQITAARATAESAARAALVLVDQYEEFTIETACYVLFDDRSCNGAVPNP